MKLVTYEEVSGRVGGEYDHFDKIITEIPNDVYGGSWLMLDDGRLFPIVKAYYDDGVFVLSFCNYDLSGNLLNLKTIDCDKFVSNIIKTSVGATGVLPCMSIHSSHGGIPAGWYYVKIASVIRNVTHNVTFDRSEKTISLDMCLR